MSQPAGEGYLLSSNNSGTTWSQIGPAIDFGDKPWLAPAPDGASVWIAALNGYWRVTNEGAVLAQYSNASGGSGHAAIGAVGLKDLVHFFGLHTEWITWNGTGPAKVTYLNPNYDSTPFLSRSCGSIGITDAGERWVVRTVADQNGSQIVLRILERKVEYVVSTGDHAFFPAATTDKAGRWHACWYDTSGSQGELRYRRSRTSDPADGFEDVLVVDSSAVPGNEWTPWKETEEQIRRLRDYIDMTSTDEHVHISWTHAPTPPARVYTTRIDL